VSPLVRFVPTISTLRPRGLVMFALGHVGDAVVRPPIPRVAPRSLTSKSVQGEPRLVFPCGELEEVSRVSGGAVEECYVRWAFVPPRCIRAEQERVLADHELKIQAWLDLRDSAIERAFDLIAES
jgi:hypothetical protein